MTDTTCPNCSAAINPGAAFCTSCGHRMTPAEQAASSAPSGSGGGADSTQVTSPGLHDSTQVYTPPPSSPPPGDSVPSAPWAPSPSGPSGGSSSTPPPPGGPSAWGQQPSAPQGAPAAPPPWQQPSGGAPTPPGAGPSGPPTWGQQQPPAGPPSGAWGAPPSPAPSGGGAGDASPLGGLATMGGALLSVIALFVAWFTVKAGGESEGLTLWSLTSGDDGIESKDAYLILALAIGAAVIGFLLFAGKNRQVARIAAIVLGVGIIGVAVYNWTQIAALIGDEEKVPAGVSASQAVGFFLAIVGGVLSAVGGVLPAKGASSSNG